MIIVCVYVSLTFAISVMLSARAWSREPNKSTLFCVCEEGWHEIFDQFSLRFVPPCVLSF